MPKRKICVVTGGRAEYDLLRSLMREIRDDGALELQLIATGMHLAKEFGLTYKTIEADGFRINEKVEMPLSGDTALEVTKATGHAVIGFADAFARLKPDLAVVLGDRYEILAAAQAALLARIPIAHLHGGELTEGALDDSIRHAITKMSALHFTAAEPYRKRVIQMGESPSRVFNFGAPGLDSAARAPTLSREEFEEKLGFKLGRQSFLVTYHPETLGDKAPEDIAHELLAALDEFPDARVILTKANADAGGRAINAVIEKYQRANGDRVYLTAALGYPLYFNAIRHVDAVVGNSSSGVIEAPFFKKPTVNIGNRQKGRLRAASVIDCGESKTEIIAAVRRALSPAFQSTLSSVESPYGRGDTATRIKEALKKAEPAKLVAKEFHDL
jgi:UDP-N-acetylglucosamine 2-epimerase (non-hydrolysing)/GDP/UDP-N,N'-diacetylbacillosamine 2-epimerase (hydrolysing)